jgi:LacI family transcriptional regulator
MAAGSVTARDVARMAGVAVGTVSRVFNNHTNVAPEMRLRVLRAAEELGYVIPGSAAASGHSLVQVGFLFSPINEGTVAASNPFWGRILAGVEVEARKSRLRLAYRSISTLGNSPAELLSAVQELGLSGGLLVGPAPSEVVEALKSLRIPLVQVDCHTRGEGLDAVVSESFEGGREATAYLIARGHRRIAHITGPLADAPRSRCTIYDIELRAHGYRAALLDAGLPIDESLTEGSNLTPQGGYDACRRLLALGAGFSALFCANDSAAIGAIRALREAGLEVPANVSVIGYDDDTDIVEHVTPALTTVHIDAETLGATAVKRLLARAADPMAAPTLTVLAVTLVKRESVREVHA